MIWLIVRSSMCTTFYQYSWLMVTDRLFAVLHIGAVLSGSKQWFNWQIPWFSTINWTNYSVFVIYWSNINNYAWRSTLFAIIAPTKYIYRNICYVPSSTYQRFEKDIRQVFPIANLHNCVWVWVLSMHNCTLCIVAYIGNQSVITSRSNRRG